MLIIMKAFTLTFSTELSEMRLSASSPIALVAQLHAPVLKLLTAIPMINCPINLLGLLRLVWKLEFSKAGDKSHNDSARPYSIEKVQRNESTNYDNYLIISRRHGVVFWGFRLNVNAALMATPGSG